MVEGTRLESVRRLTPTAGSNPAPPPFSRRHGTVFLFSFFNKTLALVMLSKVQAAALRGVEAWPVEVEVHVGPGEEKAVTVGCGWAVRESVDCVSTALESSGTICRRVKPRSTLLRQICGRKVRALICPSRWVG